MKQHYIAHLTINRHSENLTECIMSLRQSINLYIYIYIRFSISARCILKNEKTPLAYTTLCNMHGWIIERPQASGLNVNVARGYIPPLLFWTCILIGPLAGCSERDLDSRLLGIVASLYSNTGKRTYSRGSLNRNRIVWVKTIEALLSHSNIVIKLSKIHNL